MIIVSGIVGIGSAIGGVATGVATGIGGSISALAGGKGLAAAGKALIGSASAGKGLASAYGSVTGGLAALKGSKAFKTASEVYKGYNAIKGGIGAASSLFGGAGGIARSLASSSIDQSYTEMLEAQIRANNYNITLLNNQAIATEDVNRYQRAVALATGREGYSTTRLFASNMGALADEGAPLNAQLKSGFNLATMLNAQFVADKAEENQIQDAIYLQGLQGDAEILKLNYLAQTAQNQNQMGQAQNLGELLGSGSLKDTISDVWSGVKGIGSLFGIGGGGSKPNISWSKSIGSSASFTKKYGSEIGNLIPGSMPSFGTKDFKLDLSKK